MIVLGLATPFHHDPSAALLVDGRVVAAAEQERFSRNKHAFMELPVEAARYCLDAAGIRPEQVDRVAFPWSPDAWRRHRWAYVRRCARHRTGRALEAATGAAREERRVRGKLDATLERVGVPSRVPTDFVEHHLAHASSAYHLSGYDRAAILTIDGSGEFTSTLFAEGAGGSISVLHEIINPDSLGFFYSTVTEFLGFRRDDGEFKTMGMSPYGDPSKADLGPLIRWDRTGFAVSDEYVWVPKNRRHERDRVYSRAFVERYGPPRRGDGLSEPYIHIAAAAQQALEEVVLGLLETHLRDALERSGGRLCLAGGCALNVRLNRKLLAHPLVSEVFVQPAAHDAGAALGAATWAASEAGEKPEPMRHCYLGPEYGDDEIVSVLDTFRIPYRRVDDAPGLAARLLAEGEIVAWFQGRNEFGPRALGNRSILGNPAREGCSDEINGRIKFRETWRPFCPSILDDAAPEILGSTHPSPFMTLSFEVTEPWRPRIPEAVHVDGTARPQIVTRELNPIYYELISRFRDATGVPAVINTSLNRRGEPMVCAPRDALRTFFLSGLEHMVLGNVYVTKRTTG